MTDALQCNTNVIFLIVTTILHSIQFNYIMFDNSLTRVNNHEYFGLILDSTLSWKVTTSVGL